MEGLLNFFAGLTTVFEQGLILAIMVMGIYLTYKILDFPDLSVDGSFPLGAFVLAAVVLKDINPILGMFIAFLAGALAGMATGAMHVRLNISNLLAGILTMSALYSVNSRVVGKANVYIPGDKTIFNLFSYDKLYILVIILVVCMFLKFLCDKALKDKRSFIISTCLYIILFIILMTYTVINKNVTLMIIADIVFIIKLCLDYLLNTKFGFALRAIGDNEDLVVGLGVNEKNMKMFGLMMANGLVALSGSLYGQYLKFADLQMGIGTMVIGLASIIIGQGVLKKDKIINNPSIVVIGAILYQFIIYIALRSNDWFKALYKALHFSDGAIKMLEIRTTDLKLITALIVVIILAFSGKKLKIIFKTKG